MQVAIKRWYRTYNLLEMSATEAGASPQTVEFKYQAADKAQGDDPFPERYGMLAVAPSADSLYDAVLM